MKRFILLVLLAVTAFAFVPAASAAQVTTLQFRGQTANATFSSFDATGCIINDVFVFVADNRIKIDPGQPDAVSTASVVLFRFNTCTEETVSFDSATVQLNADAFQTHQLDTATLNATIPVTDSATGETYTVDLNLTFTGTGDTSRNKDHFQSIEPGLKVISHGDGSFRQATVSGMIVTPFGTLGGDSLVDAELFSARSGSITITKE